ncbi:MAG: amidase family protein [Terracidiphilus sp.]|jgi:mandelamide amidase
MTSETRKELSRREILKAAARVAPLCLGIGVPKLLHSAATHTPASYLLDLGAREVTQHIREGDIKAEVYFSALIQQCQDLKFLNGIASLDGSRMLETARAVDQARLRGETLGHAAGLPVAVKDQLAVAGYPAASGNPALKAYRPTRNAAIVDALVKAGAVAFAKTTCPNMTGNSSLAAQEDSYSPAYGVVRNPYDPDRMAGGSSGGNGVALASRMVPAALGEDTNGSVRVPAAFCGIAALRPSTYTLDNALHGTKRKRYSDDGFVISATRLDTIGPMARTVADVAFLDELITGERAPSFAINGVRIAIPRSGYWDQEWVDPDVAKATQDAFAKLREAGAHLVEIDYVGLQSTVGSLHGLSAMAIAAQQLHAEPDPPDTLTKWLSTNMPQVTVDQFNGVPVSTQERRYGKVPDLSIEQQTRLLQECAHKYQEIFRSNNVLAIAAPTVPVLPQIFTPGGSTDFETIRVKGKTLDRGWVIIAQTIIAPRYGAPALSLPVALAQGLPVGLELTGLPGKDTQILGLGIAVEKVLGRLPQPNPIHPLVRSPANR